MIKTSLKNLNISISFKEFVHSLQSFENYKNIKEFVNEFILLSPENDLIKNNRFIDRIIISILISIVFVFFIIFIVITIFMWLVHIKGKNYEKKESIKVESNDD